MPEIIEDWVRRGQNNDIERKSLRQYKVLTPNYHELVSAGVRLPVNDYSLVLDHWHSQEQQVKYISNKYGDTVFIENENLAPYGVITGLPTIGSPGDVSLNIINKLNEYELNLAMLWFERRDTFRTVASRSLQLYRSVKHIRRGKWKKAADELGMTLSQRQKKRLNRNRLDQFSDNWLEFRYGWTPILYDVYNAAGLISTGLNDGEDIFKIHSSDSVSSAGSADGLSFQYPNRGETWNLQGSYDLENSARAGVWFKVTDPTERFIEALGLTNPALIAWELVPFSFVIDWFAPIGDNLRKLTAFNGLSFIDGYYSSLSRSRVSLSNAILYGRYAREEWTGCSHIEEKVTFIRTKLHSFDALSSYNPFETENGLNAIRALDSVSLIQGLTKRRTR
jgi:hypothetical protein